MAMTQHESAPGFWLRGAMPAAWTTVPAPSDQELWFQDGLVGGVVEGALGPGEDTKPVLLFGDASGGKDSRDSRFRRVGLGLACMSDEVAMQLQVAFLGILPGVVQTVPRGELYIFGSP